ncbi:MAG: zinc ribbon domain-containing protein [Pyrobaculum sp.]
MRCRFCGAPLEWGPDSIVEICRYCNTPNFAEGVDVFQILVAPTLSSSEILERAVKRTRRDLNLRWRMRDIRFVTSPELTYLPYYFVEVELVAKYRAVVLATPRGETRRQLSRVRQFTVSGTVKIRDLVPILARRSSAGKAAERLARHYLQRPPQVRPLGETELTGVFLAPEHDREMAGVRAVRALMGRLEREVERDALAKAEWEVGDGYSLEVVSKTVDYVASRLEVSQLTYLPMWSIPYLYGNSHYRYYAAGWDGRVVLAEEPAFLEHKVAYVIFAAALGGVFGGVVASPLYVDPAVGASAALVAAGLTYGAAAAMLRSRRVE